MTNRSEILRQIEALPEPRHMFILPPWADPLELDRLISGGFLTCEHTQRDSRGAVNLLMGIKLTPKASEVAHPKQRWPILAWKSSLAGASLTVMSLVILYLA